MFVCFVVGAFYLICMDMGFILLQRVTGKYKVTALPKVLGLKDLNLHTHVTRQLLYLVRKCVCTFYENIFVEIYSKTKLDRVCNATTHRNDICC